MPAAFGGMSSLVDRELGALKQRQEHEGVAEEADFAETSPSNTNNS